MIIRQTRGGLTFKKGEAETESVHEKGRER
jgi:hypothetical protein